MIHITGSVDRLKLYIEGHANAAEHGKDIYCAAVSALSQTLLNRMQQEERRTKDVHVMSEMESGKFSLEVWVQPWRLVWARNAFDLIFSGLRKMAKQYPKYISMEEEKDGGF